MSAAARAAATTSCRVAPHLIKAVIGGSGSDAFNEPAVAAATVKLTGLDRTPADVSVAYLGTATYDLEPARLRQTAQFTQLGCNVIAINVAGPEFDAAVAAASCPLEYARAIEGASIVLVSGGNTLFAVQRWRRLGIDAMLHRAASRGCVLAGGSAGAICWFDGGHSDSMDPTSYRAATLASVLVESPSAALASATTNTAASWKYIRVSGLGFLPGFMCPHYDKTQSNGILRAVDFETMHRDRHANERGVGLDHWCVLIMHEGRTELMSLPGKEGSEAVVISEGNNGDSPPRHEWKADRSGRPGCWLLDVRDGVQVRTSLAQGLAEGSADVSAVLREPTGSPAGDPLEDICLAENPQ